MRDGTGQAGCWPGCWVGCGTAPDRWDAGQDVGQHGMQDSTDQRPKEPWHLSGDMPESFGPRNHPASTGLVPEPGGTPQNQVQRGPMQRVQWADASAPRQSGRGHGGTAHLPVGADDDFSEVVMHGRHGLADGVQGHVHFLLHPVTVRQELDHLHHHLEHG